MMMMPTRLMWLALSLLLVIMLFHTAYAVTCYECDSVNNVNCGEDFQPDDIPKTDCDSMELPEQLRQLYTDRPDTACLTKYYRGSPDEELFVRRQCAFGDFSVCDQQPDPVMPHLNFLGCAFCHKDLCIDNAGAATLLQSSLLLLPILLLVTAISTSTLMSW